MGLLDALIGMCLVLRWAAATKGKTRWGLSWADLPAATKHRAEICSFNLRCRCYNRMAAWRESSAGSVKAA